MSDYKPITGELRKYATVAWDPWPDARDRLYQMCDRIDAIHAQLERENAALKVELDRVLGEQEETIQQALMGEGAVPATEENMAEHGWVRMTKDVDGEYIHEHDKVDWRDHAGTWHENATVLAVCSDGCYVMYALDGMVIHVNKSDIRHHHAPTVEDVLREMADRIYADEGEPRDRDAIVAEYAKRLQLAGDAE